MWSRTLDCWFTHHNDCLVPLLCAAVRTVLGALCVGLSIRTWVHPCFVVSTISCKQLHQIYSFVVVGDKDELIRFRGQRSGLSLDQIWAKIHFTGKSCYYRTLVMIVWIDLDVLWVILKVCTEWAQRGQGHIVKQSFIDIRLHHGLTHNWWLVADQAAHAMPHRSLWLNVTSSIKLEVHNVAQRR